MTSDIYTARRAHVLAHIEAHREAFDMAEWVTWADGGRLGDSVDDVLAAANDCGTTCCIAGWAVALYPEEARASGQWHVGEAAKRILGLPHDEATELFYPESRDANDRAIARLRVLVEGGAA